MPAIIPGYEYDIFISYRHKDNKGDRWVTEFVQALKAELERTLKQDVSIYFDENPHDGLLENHHVDKSLEGKLKCLIFIPIISQTYCDPKSFAWQQEFCVFNRQVKQDKFGRDIKLGNGNVASRILPVKIHDLDTEDSTLLEHELGGALRSIDFIFRSTGVNRPLLPAEDHPQDNINKTFYRDQINKVANAIKEILSSLKNPAVQTDARTENNPVLGKRALKKPWLVLGVIVIVLSVAGYVLYPKVTSEKLVEEHDRSIAVLPFVDMSPAKDQEYLGDGIAEDIITTLSRIKELKVIGRTSSFQFKGEKVDLRDIGEKLNVAKVLEGSVIKSGNRIRITAQLINVSDGAHIWSERYDKEMNNIFDIQDEISRAISERMKISILGMKSLEGKKYTGNTEAFENFLRGNQILGPTRGEDAMPFFKRAIELDSSYADAYNGLAWSYLFSQLRRDEMIAKMTPLAQKVAVLDPESGNSQTLFYLIYVFTQQWQLANEEYEKYLTFNQTPLVQHALNRVDISGDIHGGIEELQAVLSKNPIDKDVIRLLGRFYAAEKQFVKAHQMINKVIEIDPHLAIPHRTLATINCMEGKFEEALGNLKRADELDSSLDNTVTRIWALASLGRIDEAKKIVGSRDEDRFGLLNRAKFNFWFGSLEEGFKLMEEARLTKDFEILKIRTNPHFDVIRDHPRFKEFLKKVDFPELE
jgi:adenylate cyclase